jgi:hypothetical protein
MENRQQWAGSARSHRVVICSCAVKSLSMLATSIIITASESNPLPLLIERSAGSSGLLTTKLFSGHSPILEQPTSQIFPIVPIQTKIDGCRIRCIDALL